MAEPRFIELNVSAFMVIMQFISLVICLFRLRMGFLSLWSIFSHFLTYVHQVCTIVHPSCRGQHAHWCCCIFCSQDSIPITDNSVIWRISFSVSKWCSSLVLFVTKLVYYSWILFPYGNYLNIGCHVWAGTYKLLLELGNSSNRKLAYEFELQNSWKKNQRRIAYKPDWHWQVKDWKIFGVSGRSTWLNW